MVWGSCCDKNVSARKNEREKTVSSGPPFSFPLSYFPYFSTVLGDRDFRHSAHLGLLSYLQAIPAVV
jgi:hypothetical protein